MQKTEKMICISSCS